MPIAVFLISLVIAALGLAALAIVGVAWYAAGKLIHPPHRRAEATPAKYGLASETVSFESSDGATLRGWFIAAPNPRGTLILCHGYAGDCSPDLIYAPLFYQANYNTLLFDFRGHGASDGNSVSLVYFERRDLLAALDFLSARGIYRVGLLGFSMGGAIAIATAPLSAMVAGVFTDCTFAELGAIMQTAFAARRFPLWLAPLLGWLTVVIASLRLRANLFSADPIRWVDQIAPRPILIMHAERDEDAPVSQARRLFNAAREPKALWIVPGARHRRIEDIARDEYRRRVLDFFDNVFANP
ncbi:MAG: alpha/beta fold hydrolase [Chloroflexota bacterium]|nr:alpha/beta fold hydrolase [Chloroflexota bacterium]